MIYKIINLYGRYNDVNKIAKEIPRITNSIAINKPVIMNTTVDESSFDAFNKKIINNKDFLPHIYINPYTFLSIKSFYKFNVMMLNNNIMMLNNNRIIYKPVNLYVHDSIIDNHFKNLFIEKHFIFNDIYSVDDSYETKKRMIEKYILDKKI
jgi:hypothetical protein